ncbi:hypothetical protein EYZ11_005678 [Aspergillus tanneri]|uniref:LYR motif-containing protein Cup1-like N-terminal domain-containing protein n=1 Tax=Aspergillus tanneri TaxID=1220188 RepID=A0A4S3JHN2_9EURO|nr:hypothetical protein EYZ11_005678 [Aspergillus tanneri]
MHDYVVQRFRQASYDPRAKWRNDPRRQTALRRAAHEKLCLLQRANEGYIRPLEKVLRLSYGRKGRKRRELLTAMLIPELPTDHSAVENMIQKPAMFEDGWMPPSIMMDLLRSQRHSGVGGQLNIRQIKELAPVIPTENSWGKPLSASRRARIRKKWYYKALENLLPPLPDAELRILDGLISKTVPWSPPKKRKPVGVRSEPAPSLDATFLTDGPQKDPTFRKYINGRPHTITRRFMERMWRRISNLVPRMTIMIMAFSKDLMKTAK